MAKDFYATRSTAWWKVAIAMIGSCLSGVTFVSVPGMVGSVGFGYLQMCVGFFLGYLVIAFVLTPLYFRLNVVSVYQYLEQRFGVSAHRGRAAFPDDCYAAAAGGRPGGHPLLGNGAGGDAAGMAVHRARGRKSRHRPGHGKNPVHGGGGGAVPGAHRPGGRRAGHLAHAGILF